MSSQQNADAIVQKASDQWELHAAILSELTPQTASLYHMSTLLPSVSSEAIIFQCFISSLQTALLIYDILLRLPYEVKHIWQRKFRLGTILYLLAQYPVVVIFFGQFIQFPIIKVMHYSPCNVLSWHICLVRFICPLEHSFMLEQDLWWLAALFRLSDYSSQNRSSRW